MSKRETIRKEEHTHWHIFDGIHFTRFMWAILGFALILVIVSSGLDITRNYLNKDTIISQNIEDMYETCVNVCDETHFSDYDYGERNTKTLYAHGEAKGYLEYQIEAPIIQAYDPEGCILACNEILE